MYRDLYGVLVFVPLGIMPRSIAALGAVNPPDTGNRVGYIAHTLCGVGEQAD
jgi:hypothetical protein